MGACATKSGDLKVKGEPPLVVEDAVAPPVAEGEKAKADVVEVPAAAETDSADVSRRRSLSVLLKEDAEASDGEDGQEEEKVVTVDSAVAADEARAPASLSEEAEAANKAPQQVAVEPSVEAEEQDTAEQLTDDPKAGQEPGSNGDAEAAAEEEKQVDPDSVQVAVAADAAPTPSPEESKAADGTSA